MPSKESLLLKKSKTKKFINSTEQRHLINHIKTRSQTAPAAKAKGEKKGESFALPLPPKDSSEKSRISRSLSDSAIPSTSSSALKRHHEALPTLTPIPEHGAYGQTSNSSLFSNKESSPISLNWVLLNKSKCDRASVASRHPSYYMSKSTFLSMLGLVTPQESDRFKHELEKSKMSRKRRSTANPKYASYTLNVAFNQLHPKRRNCKPVTLESLTPYERNDVYKKMILMDQSRFQELLLRCFVCDAMGCNMHCGTCKTNYHSDCIRIPSSKAHIPKLLALCPKCIHERKSAEKAAKEKAEAEAATAARRARAILASKNRITRAVVAEFPQLKRQLHPRRKLKPSLASIARNKDTRLRKRTLPVRAAHLPPVDENKKVIRVESEESDCVVDTEKSAIPLDLKNLPELSPQPSAKCKSASEKLSPTVPQLVDLEEEEESRELTPLVTDQFEFNDTDDSEVVILETVKHSDKKSLKTQSQAFGQRPLWKDRKRVAKILRTRAVQKLAEKAAYKNIPHQVIIRAEKAKIPTALKVEDKEKEKAAAVNQQKGKVESEKPKTKATLGNGVMPKAKTSEKETKAQPRPSPQPPVSSKKIGEPQESHTVSMFRLETDKASRATAQIYKFQNCKLVTKPKKLDFVEIAEHLKNVASASYSNGKNQNTIMTSATVLPVRIAPVSTYKPNTKKLKKVDSEEKGSKKSIEKTVEEKSSQSQVKLPTDNKPIIAIPEKKENPVPAPVETKPAESSEECSASSTEPKSLEMKIMELEEYLKNIPPAEAKKYEEAARNDPASVSKISEMFKSTSWSSPKVTNGCHSSSVEAFKAPILEKVDKTATTKKPAVKRPAEKLDPAELQKFSRSMDAVFEVVCRGENHDLKSDYKSLPAKSSQVSKGYSEKHKLSKPTADGNIGSSAEFTSGLNCKLESQLAKKKKAEKLKCTFLGKLPTLSLECKPSAKANEAIPAAKAAMAPKRSRNPKTITMRTIIPTVVDKRAMDFSSVNFASHSKGKGKKRPTPSPQSSSTSSLNLDDDISSSLSPNPNAYFTTSAFPHSKFSANLIKQSIIGDLSNSDIPDDFFAKSKPQATVSQKKGTSAMGSICNNFGVTPSPTKPTTTVTPSPTKPVGTTNVSTPGNSPLKPNVITSAAPPSKSKQSKKREIKSNPKEGPQLLTAESLNNFELGGNGDECRMEGTAAVGQEATKNVFCIRNVSISCTTCRENRLNSEEPDQYNGGCNGPKGSTNGLSNLPTSCITVTHTIKAMAAAAQSVLQASVGTKMKGMEEDLPSLSSRSPCNSPMLHNEADYFGSGDLDMADNLPSAETEKRDTRSSACGRRPASPRHPDRFTAAEREQLIDRNREIMREMIELKSTELDLDTGSSRGHSPSPSHLSNLSTPLSSLKSV